jgi:hypothetical protein
MFHVIVCCNETDCFSQLCSLRLFVWYHKNMNSGFGLGRHFIVASNPFRNRLESTKVALYRLYIKLHILFIVELHEFPNPVLYCHVKHLFKHWFVLKQSSSYYSSKYFHDTSYGRYILEHKCKLIFKYLNSAVETGCLLKCAMWIHEDITMIHVRMRISNLT